VDKRTELLDAAIGYVVEHGLVDLSLRPLAVGTGTSDRMLLYYFATKERLVEAIVEALPAHLGAVVAPPVSRSAAGAPEKWLKETWAALMDPEHRTRLVLLFELEALAARHGDPYRSAAAAVRDTFLGAVTRSVESAGLTGANARRTAALVAPMVMGLARGALADGVDAAPPAALREIAAIMRAGVGR
jgi:AcrR family transcriptional regulator